MEISRQMRVERLDRIFIRRGAPLGPTRRGRPHGAGRSRNGHRTFFRESNGGPNNPPLRKSYCRGQSGLIYFFGAKFSEFLDGGRVRLPGLDPEIDTQPEAVGVPHQQ